MGNKDIETIETDRLTQFIGTAPHGGRKLLTIPFIVYCINKDYQQSQIARLAGVKPQAVSQFIQRHFSDLSDLLDFDKRASIKMKYAANRIIDSVDANIVKKSSLQSRIVSAGILIDKARLLDGKSTANVSFIGLISQADAPVAPPATPAAEAAKKRGRGRPPKKPL